MCVGVKVSDSGDKLDIVDINQDVDDIRPGVEGAGGALGLHPPLRQLPTGHHRRSPPPIQVLAKTNLSKTFGQYATANYSFYSYVKERFIFLVMV